MRLRALGLLGASLLALAACTVGPTYQGPPPTSVAHAAAATGCFQSAEGQACAGDAVPGAWWRLYEEPELDALVHEALTANADLRLAAANLARAQAAHSEAESARLPSTSIQAGVMYGHPWPYLGPPWTPFPNFPLLDAGISVSYQVDLFGKIRRAIEASNADAEGVRAAVDLARISVAAETTRAYLEACSAGHHLEVAHRVLEQQQQSLEFSEQLERLGRASTLDVARSQSQVEQLRAELPPLEAERRVALFRLATLTGKPPAQFPRALEHCEHVPELHEQIPVGDGAALLRRRPDVRQAERALAAATARIGVAVADLYPSVSLGLTLGSTGPVGVFEKSNGSRLGIGPLISWTFPNVVATRARISQAEAGASAALAHFDGVVLRALLETESALTVYARDLERHAALTAARDRSAEAAEQAQRLFRAGRVSFLPVLDAERTLATQEAAVATSESRLASDQVALFLALGGGWEEEAAGQHASASR